MIQFCEDMEDLASSVKAFAQGSPSLQREALGNAPKYFVHLKDGRAHYFGLSKFCAFANIPLADYRGKSIYESTSGGDTQRFIRRLTGKSWIPLAKVSTESRSAFVNWFKSLPNYDRLKMDRFHLLELDVDRMDEAEVNAGSSSKRVVTPAALAAKLAAQSRIGEVGEQIALRHELARLEGLGVLQSKKCISHVSKKNVAAGFDLYSKSKEGGVRHIEVKATVGNIEDRFYMSAGELSTLRSLGNRAFLYLVEIDSLRAKRGKVVAVIRNPFPELEAKGVLTPELYRVKLPIRRK